MTPEDRAELRRIATADVSPGPWQVTLEAPCYLTVTSKAGWPVAAIGEELERFTSADAHFIAAFDPPAVLRLLDAADQRDELQARLDAVLAGHADGGESQGYFSDGYTYRDHCCTECGTLGEYGVKWPCPTVLAARGEQA